MAGTVDESAARGPRENVVSEAVIGAAIEVHRHLGPGLLESAYEGALCRELELRGLRHFRQKEVPAIYKGTDLGCAYRLDVVVEELVVVELKAIERVELVHRAQVLTYLRLSGYRLGLLINFNLPRLADGIHRIVRGLPEGCPAPGTPRRRRSRLEDEA
jgi:GxxExxY protein